MVKRIELGTSYIIPKGVLGYYITQLFWSLDTEYVEPFVYFDKHIFYKMCRKDWDWGQTVLQNIIEDLDSLIDELGTNANTHKCAIIYSHIRSIREIKNIFAERAVERPIYAYVKS